MGTNSDIEVIIEHLRSSPGISSKEIYDALFTGAFSYITLQRKLAEFVKTDYLRTTGSGKSTRYFVSDAYQVIHEIDVNRYFDKEIDERVIRKDFNHQLIKKVLNKIDLFTAGEMAMLQDLQQRYREKVSELSANQYKDDLERLSIDLSWKSSQIEGNTYSLLETERLLLNKETAAGKTKDEAVMLLNHKDAIDFLVTQQDYVKPLQLRAVEDIHSLLVKELGVDRNVRRRSVGISGTNYRPLDNEFQIREAMEEMCALVNLKESAFEKALLVLALISYIQPFNDGNKRTARIVSNALLMVDHHCPISFRTVDSLEYKKAMLIFYEQNNLSAVKKIFIGQYEFAVTTYF